jgi:hypothetical protein
MYEPGFEVTELLRQKAAPIIIFTHACVDTLMNMFFPIKVRRTFYRLQFIMKATRKYVYSAATECTSAWRRSSIAWLMI